MTTLILFKHGQALIETLDITSSLPSDEQNRLTERGRSEVERAATRLQSVNQETIIFASPSSRTRETAEILSPFLDAPIEMSSALAERRFGSPAMSVGQYRQLQETAPLSPNSKSAKEESFAEQRARVEQWFINLMTKKTPERIIVAGHGSTIEHLHGILSGAPLSNGASSYAYCAPAHFHYWVRRSIDGQLIWASLGVNCVDLPQFPGSWGLGNSERQTSPGRPKDDLASAADTAGRTPEFRQAISEATKATRPGDSSSLTSSIPAYHR